MKKLFFLLLLLFSVTTNLLATSHDKLTDSSRISLLTSTPTDAFIYSLFGHTSLRICDDSLGLDYVFDYGIFDYDSDYFVLRFIKGETDYMVEAQKFVHFIWRSQNKSVGVTEQIFNLTLEEKQKIYDALIENSLPENRIYRYNFFYDNCATRPRDIVINNINGEVKYTAFTTDQTYRDLVEECLIQNPWTRFGINLIIGSDADKVITERQKDFLPEYLLHSLDLAEIQDNNENYRPIISDTEGLLQAEGSPLKLLEAKQQRLQATNYPLIIGLFLLLGTIVLSYFSYIGRCNRKITRLFDSALFLVAGLAGIIIFFLTFFSEHPCVDKNWNLVWLNPLALLVVPFLFVKSYPKYVISYHFINFVALSLFVLGFMLIPQKLEVAFIPYILALLSRSGENVLYHRKAKNK